MKKTKICLSLLLPLVLVVMASIQTSHRGSELSKKEKEIYELMQQNEQIQMKIVKSSSLINLSENSEKYGFVIPTKVVYLDKSFKFARLP